MASPDLPVIDLQLVLQSTQLVNIHIINNKAYHVYPRSICLDGVELLYLHSPVVCSCICGKNIALCLENGEVAVSLLSFNTAPKLIWLERRLSIFARKLFQIDVTAMPNGRYIAVNALHNELVLLEVNELALDLVRSVELPDSTQAFQLSGETIPYLWILTASSHTDVRINLVDLNPAIPLTYPQKILAKCNLADTTKPEGRDFQSEDFKIFASQNGSSNEILCIYATNAWKVNFKRFVIGDLLNGCKKVESAITAVCPVYYDNDTNSNGNLVLYVLENGVVKCFDGTEEFQVSSKWRACDKFMLDKYSFCVLPMDKRVFFELRKPLDISKFVIDSRKSPWRVIALSESGVNCLGSAKKVEYESSGIQKMTKLHYLTELTMLTLTNSQYDTLCLVPPGKVAPNFKNESLISVGVMSGHTLVQVYPTVIEFHSTIAPYPLVSTIAPGEPILSGSVTEQYCCYFAYESIYILHFKPGNTNPSAEKIFEGVPISFCRPAGASLLAIGVDLSLHSSFTRFRERYELYPQRFMTDIDNKRPFGATLLVNTGSNSVIDVQYHLHVPTGWYKFSNNWELSLYGFSGILYWLDPHSECIMNETSTPLDWVDVHPSEEGVFLKGSSLYVASSGDCIRLAPKSKTSRFISSATVIDSQTLAYIEKEELRFIRDNYYFSKQLPVVLKCKKFGIHSTIKPLLIESQRVLILHGGNTCNFMDSETLEPILVSGLSSLNCDAIILWKFNDNGQSYEHLLFLEDFCSLQSYSFRREGSKLILSKKYCGAFSENRFASHDYVLTWQNHILAIYGDTIKNIVPHQNTLLESIELDGRCQYATIADHYVITNTETEILIFRLGENNGKLKQIGQISSESLKTLEKLTFKTHAAQLVTDRSGINSLYLILCADNSKGERVETFGLNFNVDTGHYELIRTPLSLRLSIPSLTIKCLQADPDAPPCREFLRAYAVLSDDSIYKIELRPQSVKRNRLVIF